MSKQQLGNLLHVQMLKPTPSLPAAAASRDSLAITNLVKLL